MVFGTPRCQRPHFDGFIYIRYAAPPYSTLISAMYLPFDTVWLGSVCWPPCATPGNEAEHRIYKGCSKTQVLFQPVCGPKFMKYLNDVPDPPYFSTLLPDCLCHGSFRRQSPLSVEVVEKPNKCWRFFAPPQLFGDKRPRLFYGRLLAQFTVHRLAKFGWVAFADLHLRSLSMKQNAEFCGGWVKMVVEFEAVCGPKFMSFWNDVGDPLWLSTHLTDCLYHVTFRRYRPLNLPLSCEVVQKGGFSIPELLGAILQILDVRFQVALNFDHVADFRWVPFSELGDQTAKIRKNPR